MVFRTGRTSFGRFILVQNPRKCNNGWDLSSISMENRVEPLIHSLPIGIVHHENCITSGIILTAAYVFWSIKLSSFNKIFKLFQHIILGLEPDGIANMVHVLISKKQLITMGRKKVCFSIEELSRQKDWLLVEPLILSTVWLTKIM